jgi:hypothetical protein
MIFRSLILQAGWPHAGKIVPQSISDFGRAVPEFALEGAAEFCAIREASLLGDIQYPALIVWISQGGMRIQQASVLDSLKHHSAPIIRMTTDH